MQKTTLFLASIGLALFITLDAMGAHALKNALEDPVLARIFTAATKHLMLASLAAILMVLCAHVFKIAIKASLILLVIGVLLFSINLLVLFFLKLNGYSLSISGMLAPIRGVFLIASWLTFAFFTLKSKFNT